MRPVHRFLALIVGATLVSVPLRAQAEWRVTNFQTVSRGFDALFQFRNIQSSGSAPIQVITQLNLSASQNARRSCVGSPLFCNGFNSSLSPFISGNVDRASFTDERGTRWVNDFSAWNYSDCSIDACYSWNFFPRAQGVLGLLGCDRPPLGLPGGQSVVFFGARTCVEEGFDGWITVPLQFRGNTEGFVFNETDVIPTFQIQTYALATVPEPSTIALLAAGLVGVFGLRRRTR